MKNNKILIIATYFPPSGGVGVFRVTKYVKYLKLAGYDPVIITTDIKYCINKDESLLKDLKNVKIYHVDFDLVKNSVGKGFYRCLKKNIDKIINIEKPKIVFLTGGPFDVLPIGRIIYNKYKIPYIIDLRDPWSLQKNNGKDILRKLKGYIFRMKESIIENYTLRKAFYTCVVNDTMKEEYQEKYPHYRFITISNGYDEDDFKDINPKKYDKFTILYSGKFSVSAGFRDPSTFFKALATFNDVNFIHVGNNEDKIINMAKKFKCINNCSFVGFKKYKEVLSYTKGADALLIISGNEPSEQTGKIFDYMGCNVPIIALTNKNNEIYKICKNLNNAIVVNNNDVEGIIKAIKKIKNNNILSKKCENNIYSRKFLCNQLIDIIKECDKNAK